VAGVPIRRFGPVGFGPEFSSDKVSRETIYVGEPWEAPEWRARWRAAPPTELKGGPTAESTPSGDLGPDLRAQADSLLRSTMR
jgi:hypothetical protein